MKTIPLLTCLALATQGLSAQAENLFRTGRPLYTRVGSPDSPDAGTAAVVSQYAQQVGRTSYQSPAQWRDAERVQQAWQAYRQAWHQYQVRYGHASSASGNVAASQVMSAHPATTNVAAWLGPHGAPPPTLVPPCPNGGGMPRPRGVTPADLPPRLSPAPGASFVRPAAPTRTSPPWTTYRTPPPRPQWFTANQY